jgi:carbamoyl-phosphate synthase large subunit
MRNRVLILSVSRKVSLVKAFKESGWHVIGQDLDPNAVALKFCDEIGTADTQVDNPVDLVIPTRDAELKLGTYRASNETIDICTDKLKFYHWCKANGFLTPEVYFVKPRVSSSGKETECVWQEFINAEEVSVDGFSDLSGNVISVVPRKRLKVISGESCVTSTIEHKAIISQSVSLAESLHLVGHFLMQCFLVENMPVWLECNARVGGGSVVGFKAGCKSPEWLLSLINGHEVKPCIGDYKVGLLGRSYSEWEIE